VEMFVDDIDCASIGIVDIDFSLFVNYSGAN